jgi:ABC-type uncharacterized transport system ATPase subunit
MRRDRAKDFKAVDHLWLHMEKDNLFCLLGHNGAGKVWLVHPNSPSLSHKLELRLSCG